MVSIPWQKVLDERDRRAFISPDGETVTLDVSDDFWHVYGYEYWTCKVRKDRIEGDYRNPEKHVREVAKKVLNISEQQIEVMDPCEIEKSLFDYVEQLKGAQYENVRSANSHSANL